MAGCSSDADLSKAPAGRPPPPPRSSTPYGTFLPQQQVPLPTAPPFPNPTKSSLQYQPPPQPAVGYHAIPVGYPSQPYSAVVDGIPMNARVLPLPFCGIGVGWALFVAGFFLASIPWYVGAFILLFVAQDYREKPGLIACSIAAVLAILSLILSAFNFHVFW
ncbi:large ribosomal subunit protein eL20z-like [Curcuma longa]|uniref:large ribosomal subunit protein eL20z-like n=1 Tax=Curcuma longa TaxID=136217 RepID=UPI003D9EB487